jgi:hypothetical protein
MVTKEKQQRKNFFFAHTYTNKHTHHKIVLLRL